MIMKLLNFQLIYPRLIWLLFRFQFHKILIVNTNTGIFDQSNQSRDSQCIENAGVTRDAVLSISSAGLNYLHVQNYANVGKRKNNVITTKMMLGCNFWTQKTTYTHFLSVQNNKLYQEKHRH